MNINNEKVFKNVDIPDMDTELNNIANEYWNNILNNYTKIANDSKKILEISLKKDICKPLVIYYLFFIIEISLKLYLLKFSTIEEVDKYAHNITRLTQKINENEKDLNFQELYFMLKKFKNSKKQNINFDKYYDFHILEHITDNKIDLYAMENNKEIFENILKKFSIIKYYNRGEKNIEVVLLIYENKPMVFIRSL